jgi:hypothetical protein
MEQFHVTVYVTNPRAVHFAADAILARTPITLTGEFDDAVRTVTGLVQSIEEDASPVQKRWRITMIEVDEQHSGLVVSLLRE